MQELKIICGNCEKEIQFISQIESGYTCCWDMYNKLIDETKSSSNVKCPHCGDFLWHPLLECIRDNGKEIEKKRLDERFSKFVLKM